MMFLCLFLILTLGDVPPATAKVLPPTGWNFLDHNACVTLTAYISGYPCPLIPPPPFYHDLYNCIFNFDLPLPPKFILLNCGIHTNPSHSNPSPPHLFQHRFPSKPPCQQVLIHSRTAFYSSLYFLRPLSNLILPSTHPINIRFSVFSVLQKSPPIISHHQQISWCFPCTASLKTQLNTLHNITQKLIMSFVWSPPLKKAFLNPNIESFT